MLGLSVGTTSRASMRPVASRRGRMSLAFEPITRRSSGQADGPRDPAREHVAEVARRHRERQPAPAERGRRPHVVRHLRRHARPVDRVGRGQSDALAQLLVAEQLLDDALAVVERAVDRDGVHVGGLDGRHLPPLHLAHAALGIEHDDLGAAARGEARDGRRARVARGRGEHRDAARRAASRTWSKSLPDELQREILEGQRRPVEELQQPLAGVELDERADGGVPEARVGLVAQALEQRGLELVARERADDGRGHARVRLARRHCRQLGPALRARTGPPSLARPASRVSQKPSAGARPRVET